MTTYKKITTKTLEKAIKIEYKNNGKKLSNFYKKEEGKIKYTESGEKSSNWTKITKKIFVEIGKGFGYSISTSKNEFKEKIWQSSEPKEFMSIDQVWFGGDERPIVGIESENSARFEEIKDDEFRKLLNFSSDFKILIWYKANDEEHENNITELQELIDKHEKIEDETFIIITFDDVVEKTLKTSW